jgi:DNA polymerase III delta prime subunit
MSIPWVEKYRPQLYENIVLDTINKTVLSNIIESSYFPNLLFYGPPGTGKTTTIINIVSQYQTNHNEKNKGLMIHLNASDERGIDIIRNQINQFVTSTPLFSSGMKFVILDEVDYMTKNAQLALRYLLQNFSTSMKMVRFCLICNYISKIDEGLQNEFVMLRFNQLPIKDIIAFLKNIAISEQMNISEEALAQIQKIYKSDIRSMINYLQSLQSETSHIYIIHDSIWEELYTKFCNKDLTSDILRFFQDTCEKYNIDKKNMIKDFLNYIISNKRHIITCEFLKYVENIMHSECKNTKHFINYNIDMLSKLLHA